jgi:carbon storage regulator
MLVLTRRHGESIKIGGDILITILKSRGQQIRIGIEAPKAIKVRRGEVYNLTNSGAQPQE